MTQKNNNNLKEKDNGMGFSGDTGTSENYRDVEVIERAGDKEDLAALYSKLAEATAEIINLEKNGYNKFHDYEYAKADDIYQRVSKVLAEKYNIQILSSPATRRVNRFTTDKGTYTEIFLEKRFSFNCGDTGAHISLDYWGYDMGKSGKFLYKAYTGCLKYFLKDNFLIDTGDPDPEMDEVENRRAASKNKSFDNKDGGGIPDKSTEGKEYTEREQIVKDLIGDNKELKNELINYLNYVKEENNLDNVSINSLTDEQFEDMLEILEDLKSVVAKTE